LCPKHPVFRFDLTAAGFVIHTNILVLLAIHGNVQVPSPPS
jgi:hypothetical protein